jgi:glutamyl-tRNA synthetase
MAAILDGLSWLGLDWDGEPVYQFSRADRHAEVARSLLASGRAYHCYCTPEELTAMRETARAEGRKRMYDGRWRDRDPADAPSNIPPVIRFKAPLDGETVIDDLVQGSVTVANEQLDDMILLRADGTPTYMLSVVVDDHDMDISHIIRGDDHLTNAFRQWQLFAALDWQPPAFAHIPLIHGPDGAKLSKRHGALGVEAYRDMGHLPEALCNYLLRLGWSHGDDEVIGRDQAIAWFDLDAVGRGAARFDFAKLENLNGIYIRETTDDRLITLIRPAIETALGKPLDEQALDRLMRGMPGLKPRAETLTALAEAAMIYASDQAPPATDKAAKLLDEEAISRLKNLMTALSEASQWDEETLETALRTFAETEQIKLGKVAQPLRAALTGSTASPGIFEVMAVLGKDVVTTRLAAL